MTLQHPTPAQRGVATLLFVLLTGLSLGALVFGAAYYVRSAQSQSLTVHALTQAQLKAWTGAEALRQYLYKLGAADAAALQVGQAVTLTGLAGVSARVASIDASHSGCGGGTRVGLSVVGSSGGANSLLSVLYCASGAGNSSNPLPPDIITINGPLKLSGDVRVSSGNTDRPASMVVNGAVTGNGSISGIDVLVATGDVSLAGSTSIDTLSSEGSINLSGSGSYTTVSAMGNIALSGGVAAGSLTANGRVSIESNSVASITAIGAVSATAAPIGSVKTQGSMSGSNTRITGSAQVQGNYTEASDGSVAGGEYGGVLSKQSWNNKILMSRVVGLAVPITPLTAATVNIPTIDAYTYRSAANYQFDRDSSNRTVVTVSQVNGVPDGTYFLAGNAGNQDFLCTSASYAADTCVAKICVGYSSYNSCFDYSNGTWSINGTTMAPGVAWFKGNLSAGSGTYYNSFIATGNITTAGSNVSKAVNYAGYADICTNGRFPSLYPRNYCASGATALTVNPVGNIVFAAGGYVDGTYAGGRIDLTASNHVYGNVLAGDLVETGGSTTIHGQVVAARQGSNSGSSSFGASTRIDLRDLPPSFTNAGSEAASAKLLWSRYQ